MKDYNKGTNYNYFKNMCRPFNCVKRATNIKFD